MMSAHPKATAGGGQDLPAKDAASFRDMVKLYEEKRYKKALKLAEQLLKRHPQHGETTAMRGIISWYIPERKEEALDWAKKGLRLNLSSPVCWHMLGLLRRNAREYGEAMRCFRQAVRLNTDNPLLWRDLSTLQIHQGNAAGFLESRKSLFFSRPNVKAHWTSYAFAQHINGRLELARRLLQTTISHFKRSTAPASPEELIEESELVLYQAQLLEEEGKFADAIGLLQANPQVHDKIGRLESLGRLFVYLGKYPEAHEAFMELFKLQPANRTPLLCSLVTHRAFVPLVEFPQAPPHAVGPDPSRASGPDPSRASGPDPSRASTADSPANGPDPSRATTAESPTNGPDTGRISAAGSPVSGPDPSRATTAESPTSGPDPGLASGLPAVWLRLSPLLLRSPLLSSPPSPTWQTHAPHLIFPGRREPASGSFRRPEDAEFQSLRPLTEKEEETLARWILEDVMTKEGSRDTALRLLLEFVETPVRFLFYLDKFLRSKILKGTPFFCCVVEGLTRVPKKATLIRQLLEGFLLALDRNERIPLGPPPPVPHEFMDTPGCSQCLGRRLSAYRLLSLMPTVEEERALVSNAFLSSLRTVLLLGMAHLADYSNERSRALEILDEAISRTPTLSELYQLKSRVLKKLGAKKAAVEALCEARELDLADRFLNTKSVKYFLDVDDVDTAAKLSLYFSNENNLVDLQSMWYELRRGRALRRLGRRAEAIQDFYRILSHFEDIRADLFDFHWYCQRRGVFRAYLQTLRMRNSLCSQRFYRKAAAHIIEMLLENVNNLSLSAVAEEGEAMITPSEPRTESLAPQSSPPKLKTKKKKKKGGSASPGGTSPSTSDPAELLLAGADALTEAAKLADMLAREAALWPRSYELRFAVAKQRGSILVMMQSLHRLWKLCGSDFFSPRVAPMVLEFMATPRLTTMSRESPAWRAVLLVWDDMLHRSKPQLLARELVERLCSWDQPQQRGAYISELLLRTVDSRNIQTLRYLYECVKETKPQIILDRLQRLDRNVIKFDKCIGFLCQVKNSPIELEKFVKDTFPLWNNPTAH